MTAAREAPNVRGGVAPNVSRTQEAADAPMCPHQITVVTGKDSAVNASTEFYKTGCLKYRVTIARLS